MKKRIGKIFGTALLAIAMLISNASIIHAEESAYSHCETASSGSVTMKVEWNDPVLGQPTTFHVSATGGSSAFKFRMDAPSYTNPNEMAYESVADPSRGEWMNYTNECNSTDYSFTMTASGTYNFRFYLMDKAAGVYYLRVSTYIQVFDSNHPSVRSIVQSAVAQCNNETDGSDYQKALWLHDWLLTQLEYDNTLKWSSAESALTRGLGTCQAYESAYSMLLSTARIENTETRDTYDGHTWNAMKLDGEWYQVDCTWDDSSDNWYNFDQRRLYFGLTDELMAVAHPGYSNIYTVSGYGTRSTTLKNNYFVKSGEAQQWVESYRDRIQNSLNSKQTQFSIQADNSTYPPSIYKIQNGIIAYVMNQNEWFLNGKKVTLVVTVNDNKFDFTVTYPTECTKHDWDEGKVTIEPTCTKDGIKTYTCKNCATTKTEIIKASGHDYSNEWTIDKEATCQEEGSKSHHCTRCDDKKDVTTIPKTDHHFDSGVETTKATCTQSGVKTYTCKDCKTTKTETIKALGHNYSRDWTIDKTATCTQEGSKSHHCTRCGDKKDITTTSKKNHEWDEGYVIKNATYSENGTKRYTCTNCGTTKDETIAKLIDETTSISYKTHVQDIGWQDFVEDGKLSGTFGQSKRLEGIQIELSSKLDGNVKYQTHVQDVGWQEWKLNGAVSGTTGQSKRLEAIRIELIGEIATKYDIYYRVHCQDFGWLGWAKNGEASGSEGYSKRLEGIQICLVKKGDKAPGEVNNTFICKSVFYRTHVQDYGWQDYVCDGQKSGTSGQSKRLEGINIRLAPSLNGKIMYRTHVQNDGWQSWKQNDQLSGTQGEAKRLEAIQIKLTGQISDNYDVYYRVHCQDFGWLGWAKNGEGSGSEGYGRRLEAIEILLVKKGEKAPGNINNSFYKK